MLIDLDKVLECYCKASSCDINDMNKCVDGCGGCQEFRRFQSAISGISGNNEEIPSNSCNSDKNLQGFDAEAVIKESLNTVQNAPEAE